jgi:hypothetical protein
MTGTRTGCLSIGCLGYGKIFGYDPETDEFKVGVSDLLGPAYCTCHRGSHQPSAE